jgi:hypothetical protein
MARETKYDYYKVIQEYYSGWCDSDFHETDSTFCFKTKEARENFKVNLKAYRDNSQAPIRVIKRKELKMAA